MNNRILTIFERVKGFLWAILWLILDQGLVLLAVEGLIFESYGQNNLAIAFHIATIILVFLISWLAWKFYRKSPYAEEKVTYSAKDGLKTIGFYSVLLIFTAIISSLMMSQGIDDTANQALLELFMNKDTSNLGLIAYGAVIVILAPVVEEVIFRGIMVTRFLPESPWLAGALSSVLFALMHSPTDIWSFALYFGMSLIMHAAYVRRGQLVDSIALHFANNAVSYLMMVLMVKEVMV